MSRVHLDLGHVGGGTPPARAHGLSEDLLVLRYGAALAAHLIAGGCPVAIAAQGPYGARRNRARDEGASAYLALHCNAAPPGHPQDYAVLLHGTATGSRALADAIARELGRLSEPRRVLVRPAGPPDWPVATAALVDVPGVPSVLIEPGFITATAHRGLWTREGLDALGVAIAEGVLRWRSA